LLNFTGNPEMRAALEKQLKELSPLRVPSRSSYFGAFDLAGFPKDRCEIRVKAESDGLKSARVMIQNQAVGSRSPK